MITVDEIRGYATALPEVEEFTHFRFRVPGFRVDGAAFAGMDKGEATAVFSVDLKEASGAVAKDPATYREVWRPGATTSFVGLRVELAKVSKARVRELVEHAWRNKAPQRLVTVYDAG